MFATIIIISMLQEVLPMTPLPNWPEGCLGPNELCFPGCPKALRPRGGRCFLYLLQLVLQGDLSHSAGLKYYCWATPGFNKEAHFISDDWRNNWDPQSVLACFRGAEEGGSCRAMSRPTSHLMGTNSGGESGRQVLGTWKCFQQVRF